MPYVVTISAPARPGDHHAAMSEAAGIDSTAVDRYAVATVEDVRNAVFVYNLVAVPEEGCNVTLPDETNIKVERVSYNHLRHESGWNPEPGDEDYSSAHRHADEVIEAFNSAFRKERPDA